MEVEAAASAVGDDDDAAAVEFGGVDAAVGVAAALCPMVLNKGVVRDPRSSTAPTAKRPADGILVEAVVFEIAAIKRWILFENRGDAVSAYRYLKLRSPE